jgi:hypothetical protein
VSAGPAERRQEAEQPRAQPSHDPSPVARKRAIRAAV